MTERTFKLGLVVNPYAGIGGALALKGSDGPEIRNKALAMGAEQKANHKTGLALDVLTPYRDHIRIYTAAGDMGQDLSQSMEFETEVVFTPENPQTEAQDTIATVKALVAAKVDIILFAGGDGTARNVFDAVADKVPVLGVPAGCKIHSGVYAITPKSAGRVLEQMVTGQAVSVHCAEVKDIDEQLFREGRVSARHYGEMQVPSVLEYVQAVKMGGKESEDLVLADIADDIRERVDDAEDWQFVMGSGSTVAAVMKTLGIDNTLLGVDLIKHGELIGKDMTESELWQAIQNQPTKLIITLIGGQGHVFGRGNQQLSPRVIRKIGRENILIVATKSKLNGLNNKPLIADTGDADCDLWLAGIYTIITGYHDQVLYPVREPTE